MGDSHSFEAGSPTLYANILPSQRNNKHIIDILATPFN